MDAEIPADPPEKSAPNSYTANTATTTTTTNRNNPSAAQPVGEGGEVPTAPPDAQPQQMPRISGTVGEAEIAAGGVGDVAVGEKREEGDGAESEGATGGATFEAASPDSESKSVIEGWCVLFFYFVSACFQALWRNI